MKNTVLFFFLFVVLGIGCKTSQQTTSQIKHYAPTANEKALLWQISGKKMSSPSYLYGTIHMINANDYFLTDSTQAAFDRMKQVVFEIDMNEMNDPTALFSLFTQAMMANGTSLKDLLSAADYEVVNQHFTKMGLPFMMLERVKPMFLSMLVSSDLSGGDLQQGEIKSYEMEFMQMAEKQGKKTSGLETLAFQLSVFDSIPYEEQATMLVDAIKLGDQSADVFQQMIQHYKNQDIIAMYQMFQNEAENKTNFETVLLTRRNRNWIPTMEKMMLEKPTFFAVGAGHLGGDDGVVALMRKAGYQVKPILPKNTP